MPARMATNAMRPKRSLLFDLPDLTENERRRRNYYLDVGLDPDNPNTGLVGQEGLSSTFGRNTSRMLEGFKLGGGGARTLTNQEMGSAWALGSKSPEQGGSFYDDMSDPRHQTVTKKFWADTVEPVRSREGGGQEFVPSFEYRDAADEKYGADWYRRKIADARNRTGLTRARDNVQLDIAGARGELMPRVNVDDFQFGSGGSMQRGGQSFEVPMGFTGERRQAMQRNRPMVTAPGRAPVSPGGQYELPDRPDPYAPGPETMPAPRVIDRRYQGGMSGSRTGAKALTPRFDPELERLRRSIGTRSGIY